VAAEDDVGENAHSDTMRLIKLSLPNGASAMS
jgi:hypothetical protein